jgi:hypothetical protein
MYIRFVVCLVVSVEITLPSLHLIAITTAIATNVIIGKGVTAWCFLAQFTDRRFRSCARGGGGTLC